MAKEVVQQRGLAIRLACAVFSISESCYRYESKQNAENDEIADWLIRLTDNHRNWGFGLCYLSLRNVKGFAWNHKRVYRIYRELELNLRIKPSDVPPELSSARVWMLIFPAALEGASDFKVDAPRSNRRQTRIGAGVLRVSK
jgi:hypothetical protein